MTDLKKERPIYNSDLLDRLDPKKFITRYCLNLSPSNPGPGLKVRPLKTSDYETGFLELLSQLTVVGEIEEEKFLERFSTMELCPNSYYITVIEDTIINKVIGTGTLIVEQKFIHNCAVRGRIEDIVISDEYRGRQLGKLLIATLTLLGEELKCYKVSLECKDSMVPYYTSLGFRNEAGNSNYLQIRFPL
ncbi:glucosamine 6-phosphate N-acetyltransferase isoform X2 [Lycorma delicatula]|uniref:glucosamine 6-phosphate N-acetyltransferase isoform X2 n=1 Tax=Lycorma delicatula TaxID=130591 RepID=UPI003F5153A7